MFLIGITGAKGSGKDTATEVFIRRGFQNVKMAAPLKAMLYAFYDTCGVNLKKAQRKIDGDLKEEPCPYLGGRTPRHAQQTLGTEWRNLIDRDLWINAWKARVLTADSPDIVCNDVRFHHEAKALRELGGRIIRIERPGLDPEDQHVSETEMNTIPVEATFQNDGTIEDLHNQIKDYFYDY